MNIILGDINQSEISDKYIILTLDTFKISGADEPVKSFCILEDIPIADLMQVEALRDLHENLIKNYGLRNWNYCEQALEHLMGRWDGQIDSFYENLSQRVISYKQHEPGPDWSPVINRQASAV